MSAKSSDTTWVLYQYTPNKGAAIALIVLFILATGAYGVEILRTARGASRKLELYCDDTIEDSSFDKEAENGKKLRISTTTCTFIPFFIGCMMEVVGYIGRAVSSSNRDDITPFIIQSILLLIAPALYAATIYMVFGRLLRAMSCQSLMLVSARFGTSFFVFGDVISFFLQAAGGGLMAQGGGKTTGTNLIIAGLVVQVVFFGFFILNEVRFALFVKDRYVHYNSISKRWWFLNITLLSSSIFIMVRSIIRIVEFAQGNDGYIISHEYFIYVFDAVPMLLVIIVFAYGSLFGNIFDVIVECQKISLSRNLISTENGIDLKN